MDGPVTVLSQSKHGFSSRPVGYTVPRFAFACGYQLSGCCLILYFTAVLRVLALQVARLLLDCGRAFASPGAISFAHTDKTKWHALLG